MLFNKTRQYIIQILDNNYLYQLQKQIQKLFISTESNGSLTIKKCVCKQVKQAWAKALV